MVKQIPPDEWLCPGINYGCVIKFDDNGVVTESLWDPGGQSHPTITSVREHKGYLYIGGLENNRIGRIRLPERRPDLGSARLVLGSGLAMSLVGDIIDRVLFPNREIHVDPGARRRVFAQPAARSGAASSATRSSGPTISRSVRTARLYVSSGDHDPALRRRRFRRARRVRELGRSGRRPCLDAGRPAARVRLEAGPRRAFFAPERWSAGSIRRRRRTDRLSDCGDGRGGRRDLR